MEVTDKREIWAYYWHRSFIYIPSCRRQWGGGDRRDEDRAASWKKKTAKTNRRSGRLRTGTGVEETSPKRRRFRLPIWSWWKRMTNCMRPKESWTTARWRCILRVTRRTSPPPHFLSPFAEQRQISPSLFQCGSNENGFKFVFGFSKLAVGGVMFI